MSNLQKRINEETKSVQWGDIFTPEERQKYINLRQNKKYEEAEKLYKMAESRNKVFMSE